MVWIHFDNETADTTDFPIKQRDVTPVRSLYIDCSADTALGRLSGAENIGSAGTVLLSLRAAEQTLLAGVQHLGKNKTAFHIVLDGGPERNAARRPVAVWAEDLRRDLEHGGATAIASAVRRAAP